MFLSEGFDWKSWKEIGSSNIKYKIKQVKEMTRKAIWM